ncbi:protocatechuate 3,4-dioxygenase [Ramlibacter sp.]|uniref:protocatechuate 3,4-dioxygenase n=1 Tax=Ramlibacter sp. TaxID=1917967 RepID=UPI00182AEDCB|nr:protocatechuate 3,4-dioxygenase [Ramlibacter sp.]MBA2675054.1 intradiol ring-cleavage dioxygenase [Ramlibacter sp.]
MAADPSHSSRPHARSRPLLSRRSAAAALVVFPASWSIAQPAPAAPLRRTPAQTEGPFYPVALPGDSDFDLLRNGARHYAQGQPAWVSGQVLDLRGKPVAGAQVEIWQCDDAGHYHHPGDGGRADPAFQGFGRVTAGAGGAYRFRTIRPVAYAGRTPHVHFKVKLGQRELLTTQLYVQGDPRNESDGVWRRLQPQDRAVVTVPFSAGPDGLQARFPIVVDA